MQVERKIADPELWLKDVFSARAVKQGRSVRRQIRDIERYAGWDRFLHEVERSGFQAVRNRDHVVIFCNADPIRRVV